MLRNILTWLGYILCAAWLAYSIDREFLELDPGQFGFKAPEVEAEMKNCTSIDMRSRYDCKERAIDAFERKQFVATFGNWMIVFAPPILVGWLLRRLSRGAARGQGESYTPPPPIKKWKVK